MSIYESIAVTLNKKGMNIVTGNIYDMISIWKGWYRGSVNDFHYYNGILADGTTIACERLTMNMAKKVAEDFSKLLWSEKVEINLDTKKKTKQLWDILNNKRNNFAITFPQMIEKSFALGTEAMVEYKINDETVIEYIDGDNIIPYAYDNNYITGFIAINQFTKGIGTKKRYLTHLTFHEFTGGVYIKYNQLYTSRSSDKLGKEIPFESMFPNVVNPVVKITDTPHFQILTPNIVNNYDLDTPMGISVYGNSLDKFKALDIKYDSFMNEFELGKKRILVDKTALKSTTQVDSEGNISNVSYFDRDDKVYQAINGMSDQPVKEIDFTLRHEEHIGSINADLNWLSAAVGLGQSFYSFDGTGVKTATEVISENSDTYRTKVHHQIVITNVLTDLIKSIMNLEGIKSKDINIKFDDSIIEDENAFIERGLKLLSANSISLERFMRKYLKYDDAQVTEELARLKEENKTVTGTNVDFFGTQD